MCAHTPKACSNWTIRDGYNVSFRGLSGEVVNIEYFNNKQTDAPEWPYVNKFHLGTVSVAKVHFGRLVLWQPKVDDKTRNSFKIIVLYCRPGRSAECGSRSEVVKVRRRERHIIKL